MTAALSCEDVARELARWHARYDESGDMVVYWCDGGDDTVRLVEVSTYHFAVQEAEVEYFSFLPVPEHHGHALQVALLAPAEWDALERGELRLPPGWGAPVRVWPADGH